MGADAVFDFVDASLPCTICPSRRCGALASFARSWRPKLDVLVAGQALRSSHNGRRR
jgi:hypothetical protein